jgi:hypothetical protein
MTTVRVDTSNPDVFKQKDFTPVPKGTYTLECRGADSKAPIVVKAGSSDNMVVNFEYRICDEGEHIGKKIFDCCTITAKAEWRLIHLALACGTQTKEDITQNGVDLDKLEGARFSAEIDIEPGGVNATDPSKRYRDKNRITRYLFEPEKVS